MRRRRTRKRSAARMKADGVIPADVPRCCTCSKPLLRLPASLASRPNSKVFQCSDCFYPGTGRKPERSAPVGSEKTRWLSEFTSDPSS